MMENLCVHFATGAVGGKGEEGRHVSEYWCQYRDGLRLRIGENSLDYCCQLDQEDSSLRLPSIISYPKVFASTARTNRTPP